MLSQPILLLENDRKSVKNDIIRSVQRALSILELLAQHLSGLNAKQVSLRLHLHLSTTYHLLNTLMDGGYVVKDPDTMLFRLSGKMGYAVYGSALSAHVVRQLTPHVQALQETTQETAYLSLWDGEEIALSAIAESPLSVRVKVLTIGYSEGNHAMALGKTILAYLDREDLDRYFAGRSLTAFTPNTCTEVESLKTLLTEVRHHGYGLDLEEFLPDVCCIGAPIFDAQDNVTASIAISLPRSRYDARHDTLVPQVKQAAAAATRAMRILGYARPARASG